MDDSEAQVYTQTDEEAVEEETDRANKDSCERKDEVPQKESSTSMAGLRQRKSSVSRENETTNIEHVLQHHRQLHDELTTDLGRMAKQLKLNSQAFGDILSKDDYVLQEATKTVENNLEKMTLERQRLDKHYSKSWGTSFMSLFVVLFVVIMFVLVYFTIRYLPKP
ncbi:vesicle transport protein [Mycotypha africana]|uniref:vesicle transport protein n=1 Tax=Mycotypha africana TaxID=64632 RepID=UPI002301F65B|nr:vesicle transport protein [Mycotypha africana]KAI8987556.1 vesicle transport protein [Mycotypha africana]